MEVREMLSRQEIRDAWKRLGDTPINDDEEIDTDYEVDGYKWAKGTHREDIWSYFDDIYPGGIACLMGLEHKPYNQINK